LDVSSWWLKLTFFSFARHFVRKRLAEGITMRKDMMQMHISNGMNEEELIQQAFISM
jgi:hypothetical protein